MANDLATRNVRIAILTDLMYTFKEDGTIEGKSEISQILSLSTNQNNTTSNAGSGAQLAKAKMASDLPIRTLISSDSSISFVQGSDEIDIKTDKEINTSSNTGSGAQLAKSKSGVDLPFRTLVSSDGSIVATQNTDEINLKAVRVGVYRNIWIGAGAMVPQATDGATTGTSESTTNLIMNDFFDFLNGADEFTQFSIAMPDEWDRGVIKFKFYWSNATAGTGNVLWQIRSGAISNDDEIDTALGTAITVLDSFITDGDLNISSATAAVTVAGTPALEDLVYFQIGRIGSDVSDDYDEPARLLGVLIQYKESLNEPTVW